MRTISISDKFKVQTLCLEYTGNIAPCRRSHLLKYTSFPAVETGNIGGSCIIPWCKDKQLCKGYFPYLFLVNQKLTWRGVYISRWGFGGRIQIGEEANNAEVHEFPSDINFYSLFSISLSSLFSSFLEYVFCSLNIFMDLMHWVWIAITGSTFKVNSWDGLSALRLSINHW